MDRRVKLRSRGVAIRHSNSVRRRRAPLLRNFGLLGTWERFCITWLFFNLAFSSLSCRSCDGTAFLGAVKVHGAVSRGLRAPQNTQVDQKLTESKFTTLY
jgi:hypothetical protein